jgi:hypothetical protein
MSSSLAPFRVPVDVDHALKKTRKVATQHALDPQQVTFCSSSSNKTRHTMGEAPSWQYMWGAKVKMPCDMEDDVLEDVIKHVTTRLAKFDTEEWEKKGLAVRDEIAFCICDARWSISWRVRGLMRVTLLAYLMERKRQPSFGRMQRLTGLQSY